METQIMLCAGCLHNFLLFHDDKAVLHSWHEALEAYLVSLRLTIHLEKSVVFPVKNGIPFLGFILYPNRRRLKKENVRSFLRRFRHQRRAIRQGRDSWQTIEPSLTSWNAHASHGDTWRLRSNLFQQRPIPPTRLDRKDV